MNKMIKLFFIVIAVFFGEHVFAQSASYSTLQVNSADYMPVRDTNWRPARAGAFTLWQHSGVDTIIWQFNGQKWVQSGGSNIPTWQQTLIAGSAFTQDNYINARRHYFIMDSLTASLFRAYANDTLNSFIINQGVNTYFSTTLNQPTEDRVVNATVGTGINGETAINQIQVLKNGGTTHFNGFSADTTGATITASAGPSGSYIYMYPDSIKLKSVSNDVRIPTNYSNCAGCVVMVQDSTTGRAYHIPYSSITNNIAVGRGIQFDGNGNRYVLGGAIDSIVFSALDPSAYLYYRKDGSLQQLNNTQNLRGYTFLSSVNNPATSNPSDTALSFPKPLLGQTFIATKTVPDTIGISNASIQNSVIEGRLYFRPATPFTTNYLVSRQITSGNIYNYHSGAVAPVQGVIRLDNLDSSRGIYADNTNTQSIDSFPMMGVSSAVTLPNRGYYSWYAQFGGKVPSYQNGQAYSTVILDTVIGYYTVPIKEYFNTNHPYAALFEGSSDSVKINGFLVAPNLQTGATNDFIVTQNANNGLLRKVAAVSVSQSDTARNLNNTLVAYGDSRTECISYSAWVSYLAMLKGYGAVNPALTARYGYTAQQILSIFLGSSQYYNNPTYIASGFNNIPTNDTAAIITSISQMVDTLNKYNNPRYYVVGIFGAANTNYWSGTTNYTIIQQVNARLAADFPGHYLDDWTYLQNLPAITAQDVIDKSHGVIPASYRSDSIHLNSRGYDSLAAFLSRNFSAIQDTSKLITAQSLKEYFANRYSADLPVNGILSVGGYGALTMPNQDTSAFFGTISAGSTLPSLTHTGYNNAQGQFLTNLGIGGMLGATTANRSANVGWWGLHSITTGTNNNNLSGDAGLKSCLTCTGNNNVGNQGQYYNTIGTGNVSVGDSALRGIAIDTPTNVIAVGAGAAQHFQGQNTNAIIIGAHGVDSLNNAPNSLFIGAYSKQLASTIPGQINIMGIMQGINDTATSSGVSNGSVGFGIPGSYFRSRFDVRLPATFGDSLSTSTIPLAVIGGRSGTVIQEWNRQDAGIRYGVRITNSGFNLYDNGAGVAVMSLYSATNNQLYIGENGKSSSDTRQSILAGRSFSTAAGTDVAAQNFTIRGNGGTGAGIAGDILFQTGNVLASGTAQQTFTERFRIAGNTGLWSLNAVAGTANQIPAVNASGNGMTWINSNQFILNSASGQNPGVYNITNTNTNSTTGSFTGNMSNITRWTSSITPSPGYAYNASTNYSVDTFSANLNLPNSAYYNAGLDIKIASSTASSTISVGQGTSSKRAIAARSLQWSLPQIGAGITTNIDYTAGLYVQGVYQAPGTTNSVTATNYYGILIGQVDEQLVTNPITNKYPLYSDDQVNPSVFRGPLYMQGGTRIAYTAKTGTYAATNNDYVIDCTSGTFTVTLPSSQAGQVYIIKNSGAGVITIATTGGQTIDGAATKTLITQYSGYQVTGTGSGWAVTASF